MSILDTITELWDGFMIPFPEINGMENIFSMFMTKAKPRALIARYSYDQDWMELPDVVIPWQELKKILFVDKFFNMPAIIAVEYKDRDVYIKVADLHRIRDSLLGEIDITNPDETDALIPKSLCNNLKIKEKAA